VEYIGNNKFHILNDDEEIKLFFASLSSIFINNNNIIELSEHTDQKFTIEKLKEDDYYGFTLYGEERFFLSNGMIVHNTTVSKIICNLYQQNKQKYIITSFTGKAVCRIKQILNKKEVYTMDQMIYSLKLYFEYFDAEYLIIDEASMISSELFYFFIQKYSNIKSIIFIGDVNQLQPISWGSLFIEMFKLKNIHITNLKKNFRVKNLNDNYIYLNCKNIVENFQSFQCKNNNFEFSNKGIYKILKLVKSFKDEKVSLNDFIIISPYNKSVNIINTEIQKIYQSNNKKCIYNYYRKFHLNDKVIFTENDYNIGIFNGEFGYIKDFDNNEMNVTFDKDVELRKGYKKKIGIKYGNINNLNLGYCITVDKSQGSEWNYVIFYIPYLCNGNFFNKNRIYTALSRSKMKLWIITDNIPIQSIEEKTKILPNYRHDNLSNSINQNNSNIDNYQ